MKLSGRSIIGFGSGTINAATFRAHNPVNGEALSPDFYSASAQDLTEAVRLADEAFATYSRTAGSVKATFLRKIAANIEAIAEAVIAR